MNKRTEAVYQFIKGYITANRYPPTRREIGARLHISTSMVSYYIRGLQDAGRLNVVRDVARGIVLVDEAGELEPRPGDKAICKICGDEIFCRKDMGRNEPPYWIHFGTKVHKHKPEPTEQPAPDNADWQAANRMAAK